MNNIPETSMHALNSIVLETRGLSKSFKGITSPDSGTSVIRNLNLQVRAGETVAIVGASGAGKSTLLHVLGGLEKPNEGEVLWNGESIHAWSLARLGAQRNKTLGFIYQFHHLLPEFSALENVALALRIGGTAKKEACERAEHTLAKLGLSQRIQHRPAELSGGERQRVAIARALVTKPKAILADEPTGNLDLATADQVFASLLENNREAQAALIMVTHSMELASRCERVLRLSQGCLVED